MKTWIFRHHALSVSLLLVVFAAQALISMSFTANVFDEISHLGSGYLHLFGGSPKQDEHPAFAKFVACLPLLLYRDRLKPPDAFPAFKRGESWGTSFEILYANNVDAETILYTARIPGILWGVLLGVLVYLFAHDLYGGAAGLAALFLYTFSPNLLAHCRLVTLDFPVTVFFFGAVFFLFRCCRRFRWTTLLLCLAFCGMAVGSKISGMAVLPVVALLLLLRFCTLDRLELRLPGGALNAFFQRLPRRGRKTAVASAALLALAVAVPVMIWAVYGFRYEAFPSDSPFPSASMPNADAKGLVHAACRMAWDHKLLPQHFLVAFKRVLYHVRQGHQGMYLNGRILSKGSWLYFPFAILIKTPIATLLLLFWALLLAGRRHLRAVWAGLMSAATRHAPAPVMYAPVHGQTQPAAITPRLHEELFVLLPPLLFLAMAVVTNLNLGLRHVLPIYPFLLVFAGSVFASDSLRRPVLRPLPALLLAWYLAAAAFIFPYHLAYFNEFVGGPRQGWRHLVDSNLDWGQDLKGLKRFMDRHGIEKVKLSYFGTADPSYYGINHAALPSKYIVRPQEVLESEDFTGVYAISATILSGAVFHEQNPWYNNFLKVLRETVEPIGHVGYSIYIYRLNGIPNS